MITMLLDGLNDDLKVANEVCDWMPAVGSADGRDQVIHQVANNPLYFVLTGGGPDVTTPRACRGAAPTSNANGDPSVDCGATRRGVQGQDRLRVPQAVQPTIPVCRTP